VGYKNIRLQLDIQIIGPIYLYQNMMIWALRLIYKYLGSTLNPVPGPVVGSLGVHGVDTNQVAI
jgi:hypothetical protein